MGYPLTNISDYQAGKFSLPVNTLKTKDLLSFIDSIEEDILSSLLGVELADLYIQDLDTNNDPQTDRFKDIGNEFSRTSSCDYALKSKGIKDMLKGFVCFYYARHLDNITSMVGTISPSGENSDKKPFNQSLLINLYNSSVTSYLSIQQFILDNEDIYPEFDGEIKDYLTII